MRVLVENFQSIKKAEIEVNGFTVVTGPNNSGKTALMRAVRGVFINPPAASYVRHGAKSLKVRLEFEDGQFAEWRKGGRGSNEYTINGHELKNVGRNAPDQIATLGILPIKVGTSVLWPQIAQQITGQVFLLDEVGSVVAEAIADVNRVRSLNEALRDVESDKRAGASKLKVRYSDRAALEEELEMFQNLEEVEQVVAFLVDHKQKAKKAHSVILSLGQVRDQRDRENAAIHKLSPVEDIKIPSDEVTNVIKSEARKVRELEKLRDQYQAVVQEVNALDSAVDELQEFLTLRDYDDVFDQFRAALGVLGTLSEQRAEARSKIHNYEGSLEEHEADLAHVNDLIKELTGSLPECPVCGSLLGEHDAL